MVSDEVKTLLEGEKRFSEMFERWLEKHPDYEKNISFSRDIITGEHKMLIECRKKLKTS